MRSRYSAPAHVASRHRQFVVAASLLLLLIVLPQAVTRPVQSAYQIVLQPGHWLVQSVAARFTTLQDYYHTVAGAVTEAAAQRLKIEQLEHDLKRVSAERDVAATEALRRQDNVDDELDLRATSRPLLMADFVRAAVLSSQSQSILARRQLIDRGTKHGIDSDALVVESPRHLLDQGLDQGLDSGQLIVTGTRVWGKVAVASRWTSAVCQVTDAAFRDVVLIVSHAPCESTVNAVRGVLYGTDQPKCRIRHVASNQPVAVGDWVLSAASDNLGCGPLAYGQISQIEQPNAGSDWEIWVTPSIGRDAVLAHVAVVRPAHQSGTRCESFHGGPTVMMQFTRLLCLIPIVYALLAGAADASQAVSISNIAPDPWAVAGTLILVCGRSPQRWWLVGIIGLLADLSGLGCLGLVALIDLAIGYAAVLLLTRLRRFDAVAQVIAISSIAALLVVGPALAQFAAGDSEHGFGQLCQRMLWSSTYTAFLCWPVVLIRSWWLELSFSRNVAFPR